MFFLLSLLVSCIRIMLLFYGALFTFILGESLYRFINTTLFAFTIPCIEMISLLVAVVAPITYFFGIHHQKGFLQREGLYNKGIFLLAFLFGTFVTFLPINAYDVSAPLCTTQISLPAKIMQSITTGVLTALISFISFDIGVFQALYLTPVLRNAAFKKR